MVIDLEHMSRNGEAPKKQQPEDEFLDEFIREIVTPRSIFRPMSDEALKEFAQAIMDDLSDTE